MARFRGRLLAIGVAMVAAAFGYHGVARGQALIADLSDHLIAINTGFTGVDLLLFGTIDQPGDIVVLVNGPTAEVEVRRKQRIAGIWINSDRQTFMDVPSFYHVASSRPIETAIPPALREEMQIGLDHLVLTPADDSHADELPEFRAALVRNMQALGHYGTETGQVSFLGNQLFRTTVTFPANVPTGSYRVQVLLIRDGEIAGAQTTPLNVGKIGFDADVFQFAHNYSAIFGLMAIAGALMAGWIAHLVFRRL